MLKSLASHIADWLKELQTKDAEWSLPSPQALIKFQYHCLHFSCVSN